MIAIYKKKGETPLQTLDRLRREKPEYVEATLSYAGRLDPMAEGVMLVLVGEENKNKEKHLKLDKTYVTEILFGISSDTGDVLGKVKSQKSKVKIRKEEIEIELRKSTRKFEQKYPQYSSKSFAGEYRDVREGKMSEVTHEVEMYSVELLEMTEMSAGDLLAQIKKDVSLVIGDFRQEEIVQTWQELLSSPKSHLGLEFPVVKIRLKVSSGFYVRQFAEDVGESLGSPAFALSIVREEVGEWGIKDCIL